jgi:putative FmdB family regulatory protein
MITLKKWRKRKMPMYSYKCKKCEREVTLRLSTISTPQPKVCKEVEPKIECDGELEKILAPSSFSLKGAGWFKDGY